MKKFSTLLLAAVLVATLAKAQTVYNVTSNRSWSSTYPTSCINCTFNISTGVTLTIDRNITLQNAVFNGGNVVVANNSVTLQTSNNGKTYFNNTKWILNSSSRMVGSAPVYMTNSTFTFNSTSFFNPQNLLEMSNSRLNFYGDSYLTATGGPVNLKNNSMMVAGDGTLASDAYLFFNGPLLVVYDNSALIVANNNNYYFNWAPYYGVDANKFNFTTSNNKNCGPAYPHGCSTASLYGPVNMQSAGVTVGNALPVVLSDFSVRLSSNIQAELTWVTDQESNSNRFEVERSIDGANWTTIARIDAKGNASIQSKYAFTDKAPAAGINYYRLKMVDLDNTYDYSAIKSVRTVAATNVRVYPNPATNYINVSLPSTASVTAVRLLNTAGQVLQDRKTTAGAATVSFEVSGYTAGTYIIQTISKDGSSNNSLLLIGK